MKNMTLQKIAQACKGSLHLPSQNEEVLQKEASCVVINSAKLVPDGIFIATVGQRVDGHSFINEVAKKGALGVVCEKEPKDCEIPYILVEDSFCALRRIAEFYRKQLDIQVVGISGSVGKTSTKEFIASVLSVKYQVLKTEGNFNNEVGLPLTVLSIREEHEVAVLEMGISDFGEMHRLSEIAQPDICVLTNIGTCHLENLGSREGVLKAKSEIFDCMDPNGYVFVNGDDDLLSQISGKGGHPPIHFGVGTQNEIYASSIESKGLFGSHAVLHMGTWVFPVEISLPGEHMVWNALAAAAVGKQLGLDIEEIKQGILNVRATRGRSYVMALPTHTVIDDSYNANPGSMRAAIELLLLAEGRKAAVLGDMFELGENEERLHYEVGAYAAERGIDVLVFTGTLSRHMYEGACARLAGEAKEEQRDRVYYFQDKEQMLENLPRILKPEDTVLVKASHGMHFEEVVEFLQK